MSVKDVQASKNWYKQFLSLEPIEDLKDFVSFKIGSTMLNFHQAGKKSPLSQEGSVVYWGVDDLQEAINKAVSMGGNSL